MAEPVQPAPRSSLEGHHDWVTAGASAPDGTHLASAGDDFTLVLLTPSAIDNDWILWEAGLASGMDSQVVPLLFRVDHHRVPKPIDTAKTQTTDGDSVDGMRALVTWIAKTYDERLGRHDIYERLADSERIIGRFRTAIDAFLAERSASSNSGADRDERGAGLIGGILNTLTAPGLLNMLGDIRTRLLEISTKLDELLSARELPRSQRLDPTDGPSVGRELARGALWRPTPPTAASASTPRTASCPLPCRAASSPCTDRTPPGPTPAGRR
jgi:hypothetical protein